MRSLTLLLCCLPLSSALADGTSFYDPFEKLDIGGRWWTSDGWSNGKHQSCVWASENVQLVDGRLDLLLTDVPRKGHPYSCGELQSHDFYGYGTYEVRMKPAALSPGLVSAFFTYTGSPHHNPHDEIDFEFVAARHNSVDTTYHANDVGYVESPLLDIDPRAGFNDYAFHWTPDRITWYVNGKVLREVKRSADAEFPTTPSRIYISIWTGTEVLNSWLGPFVYPGAPLVASYEHIAYTKLGDDCQFPESIVCTLGKDKLGGN
jgi:endo-1,3-1,4-beta-glycanase ExoK